MSNLLEFKGVKSRKPTAPRFVAYLAALGYFLVALLLGILLFRHQFIKDIVLLIILVSILVTLVFLHLFFEWFINGKVTVQDGVVIYTVNDIVGALGVSLITERITNITRVQIKRNAIVVYGTVVHKESLMKERVKRKAELLGHFVNEEELIRVLFNLVERNRGSLC